MGEEEAVAWYEGMTGLWVVLGAGIVTSLMLLRPRRPLGFPPGPLPLPIAGNLLSFSGNRQDLKALRHKYGPIFSVAMGRSWWVFLNDYDTIQDAFVHQGAVFAGRPPDPRDLVYGDTSQIGLEESGVTEEWRRQRRFVMQALLDLGFGQQGSEVLIQQQGSALTRHITSCSARPQDISHVLAVSVANVVSQLLFGESYTFKDGHVRSLLDLARELVALGEENTAGDFIPWARHLWPAYRHTLQQEDRVRDKLDGLFEKKLERCWEAMERRRWKRPGCLMEAYVAEIERGNGGQLTQDWSMEVLYNLFLAATETTTTTLRWALLYMAVWPEVQAKVHGEMDRVVGRGPKKFSMSDRARLPYTAATVTEVQRRATVSPTTLPHSTTHEARLGKYTIPKGTTVLANQYSVLMDPVTWPEPEEFRPERFLDEAGQLEIHPKWIPFGMGRRMCLGVQLAKQELFILFSTLVHHFHISLPDSEHTDNLLEPKESTILQPKPHQLLLQRRH